MKLYERIENNNFDEIDRNRAIELIEGGNGHLVYNENYFKLQKENEEVKRLIAHKNEYTKKLEEDLFENAENYVISKQKVKDKIEKYKKLSDKFYVKFLESDRYNTDIREKGIKCDAIILALEELIEEREEKAE
jgi:hypothetical protein